MSGYTYASYQAAVVTQIPTVVTDPNFVTMLPNSIDYAEFSIYRDLDWLNIYGDVSLNLPSAASETQDFFSLSSGSSVVLVERVRYPNDPLPGTTPVTPASADFIYAAYGSAPAGPPQYYAVIGHEQANTIANPLILFGPKSDKMYILSAYCKVRPAPLSEANPTTQISQQLPDLFWAAAMIYWTGYMKNFGAQSDDPRMAVSWEQEYQRLLKGASAEEAIKKFQGPAWNAQSVSPMAAQPRG